MYFYLTVQLSASSLQTACVDWISYHVILFPSSCSNAGYIDISEYGFYFEGRRKRLCGTELAITRSTSNSIIFLPLELTCL
jgi:hypothetical protein